MADFNVNVTAGVTPVGEVTELALGLNDPLMIATIAPTGALTLTRPLQSKNLAGTVALAGTLVLTQLFANFQVSTAAAITPAGQLSLNRPLQSKQLAGTITPSGVVTLHLSASTKLFSGTIAPSGTVQVHLVNHILHIQGAIGPTSVLSLQPTAQSRNFAGALAPTATLQTFLGAGNAQANVQGTVAPSGVLSLFPVPLHLEGNVTPSGVLGTVFTGVTAYDTFFAGNIAPSGEMLPTMFGGGSVTPPDNLSGEVVPHGELTILATMDVPPAITAGEIFPMGAVKLTLGVLQCVTQYACIDIVHPVYACVDVCAPPVPLVEEPEEVPPIELAGTITLSGLLDLSLSEKIVGGTIAPEGDLALAFAFTWFKQVGFSPAQFLVANRLTYSPDFSGGEAPPTYTVGVPLGHVGDGTPVIDSADYEVSVVVHTKGSAIAGSSQWPMYHGGGVIARAPLTATFFKPAGYYFVYYTGEYRLVCVGLDDLEQWREVVSDAGFADDADHTLMLRVVGNQLTCFVDGIQVIQRTDNTFTEQGRPGLVATWPNGSGAWVKGPWRAQNFNVPAARYLYDSLLDSGDIPLEAHVPTA